jgi:hypothetical protein
MKLRKLLNYAEPLGHFMAFVPGLPHGERRQQVWPSTVAYLARLIIHRYAMLGVLDEEGFPLREMGVLASPSGAPRRPRRHRGAAGRQALPGMRQRHHDPQGRLRLLHRLRLHRGLWLSPERAGSLRTLRRRTKDCAVVKAELTLRRIRLASVVQSSRLSARWRLRSVCQIDHAAAYFSRPFESRSKCTTGWFPCTPTCPRHHLSHSEKPRWRLGLPCRKPYPAAGQGLQSPVRSTSRLLLPPGSKFRPAPSANLQQVTSTACRSSERGLRVAAVLQRCTVR